MHLTNMRSFFVTIKMKAGGIFEY